MPDLEQDDLKKYLGMQPVGPPPPVQAAGAAAGGMDFNGPALQPYSSVAPVSHVPMMAPASAPAQPNAPLAVGQGYNPKAVAPPAAQPLPEGVAPVEAPRPANLTSQELKAAGPHGWRKGLGLLSVGMGGFKSPALGQELTREVFEQPRERAEQERGQEQKSWDIQHQQAAQETQEKGRGELEKAQTAEAKARAETTLHPPAKPPEPKFKLEQVAGPDGKPMFAWVSDETRQVFDMAGKELSAPAPAPKEVAPKEPKRTAGMWKGQPAFGEERLGQPGWFNPENGQPMPGFQPAPTYGEVAQGITNTRMSGQTKVMFGADGKPQEFQFNPATKRYDTPIGYATQGQAGSREAQANIVEKAGANLIHDLTLHKQNLGTLTAWYGKHTLDVPYLGDPVLGELDGELRSFAALNPAMHGFRSTNALETFEKIIGGLQKNPDATIGSIRGILKTAGAMSTVGEPPAGGPAAPVIHSPGKPATGLTEGQTGTGSDGKKYVVKGGIWAAQ